MPKPKDWAAFQRNCAQLFRQELGDPHLQEYGRLGQNQQGVDLLGRRDGLPSHAVGVQCRLISKRDTKAKILQDCRAALKLCFELKEIIFATSAPNDVMSAKDAHEVETELRASGHDVRVIIYGWEQLEHLVSQHESVWPLFNPGAYANKTPVSLTETDLGDLAAQISERLVSNLQAGSLGLPIVEAGAVDAASEDPALHARIDTYRDLIREDHAPKPAKAKLEAMLRDLDLEARPWAKYRILTNLGAVEMDLGREQVAAELFEAAYEVRPENPNAKANLALARTIQRRFGEAMTIAREALACVPVPEQALGYLLQAAARSDWVGDPASLIPTALADTVSADIGLAEFLRRRDVPGWAERTIEMARRHPDSPELRKVSGVAILSLALESGAMPGGGFAPVTLDELNAAADHMLAHANHYLDIGFEDAYDLTAAVNNAAVLLRLCERHAESEALLRRATHLQGQDAQLRRLLSLSLVCQDRIDEALKLLNGDADPENSLFRAECKATKGWLSDALDDALGVPDRDLEPRLSRIRWRFIAEIALRLEHLDLVPQAVDALRAIDPEDVSASLFDIRLARASMDDEEHAERLRQIAANASSRIDQVSRLLLAEELRQNDLPDEAARLLEGHIDLGRPSGGALTYLQSLAGARRDVAFEDALAQASDEVRAIPGVMWTRAAHAWNLGDMPAALEAVEALLVQIPNHPRARLLRLEILIRLDRPSEVADDLEKPIEDLRWEDVENEFRVAELLEVFGHRERAAKLAYKLFLQRRDLPRAWMTLSGLVLAAGRSTPQPAAWTCNAVADNCAVDVKFEDGETLFFVVEPDPELRRHDPESWQPTHPLATLLWGLKEGAEFNSEGRGGVVTRLRHKLVARLHFVLENYEARFPDVFGFKTLRLGAPGEGQFDSLISQLKERQDWILGEHRRYAEGSLPFGVFAHRIGLDVIDCAIGLGQQGKTLKVATGQPAEREAALAAIVTNDQKGCVLDLLSFWFAWRLKALDTIEAVAGPIYMPRSVVDRLLIRREAAREAASNGSMGVQLHEGSLARTERSPAEMGTILADVETALAWIDDRSTVLPVVATDDLPDALREHLQAPSTDIFDALVIASQTGALLVTDDLATRAFGSLLTGVSSAWLQAVFLHGCAVGLIDEDQYLEWTAQLVEVGESHMAVSGRMLFRAAQLDGVLKDPPGRLFRLMTRNVGGAVADPYSHIAATLACILQLWKDRDLRPVREALTGHLLRQLLRGRTGDYGPILRTLASELRVQPLIVDYLRDWAIGHFVSDAFS